MMSDGEAREFIRGAFKLRGLPTPSVAELQGIGAIGRFEGNYGAAFEGAQNWGAVHCKSSPPCPPDCIEVGETDAQGVPYRACVRIYESHAHGAADMLREIYRRDGVPAAMRAGNATLVAERMRAGGYFEAPVKRYATAIANNAKTIAKNLNERLAIDLHGVGPAFGTPSPKKKKDGVHPIVIVGGLAAAWWAFKSWQERDS